MSYPVNLVCNKQVALPSQPCLSEPTSLSIASISNRQVGLPCQSCLSASVPMPMSAYQLGNSVVYHKMSVHENEDLLYVLNNSYVIPLSNYKKFHIK